MDFLLKTFPFETPYEFMWCGVMVVPWFILSGSVIIAVMLFRLRRHLIGIYVFLFGAPLASFALIADHYFFSGIFLPAWFWSLMPYSLCLSVLGCLIAIFESNQRNLPSSAKVATGIASICCLLYYLHLVATSAAAAV